MTKKPHRKRSKKTARPSRPSKAPMYRPSEILKMPAAERHKLLKAAADKSAGDYATDPEVREWLEFDDPIEPEDDEHEGTPRR